MIDYEFLDYKEKLSVPLYKYYSNFDYAKDVIENHRIHFESPSEYNDIFDSATYITDSQLKRMFSSSKTILDLIWLCLADDISTDVFKEKIIPVFNGRKQVMIKDVLDEVYKAFPNIDKEEFLKVLRTMMSLNNITVSAAQKISCFSENKDSLLMWSYYANSHKGVCLEFDFKNDKDLAKHCHKVQYTKHFDVGNESYTYFTKSDQWQHEQEWRIVKYGDEYVETNTLKSIYLGYRINQKYVKEFISLGSKHKLDVYLVRPSISEYKLEFIQIVKEGILLKPY